MGFALLFVLKAALHLRPEGRFARALHPWLFSGLYLDELFTRLTFRVWAPRFPKAVERTPTLRVPASLEVGA